MANAVAKALTSRRYGVPDSKTAKKKNPSRNGVVMTCTGCGSEDHFYKECTDPNKETFRAKKLKEIAEMKRKSQKSHLRSYFLQMDEISSDEKTEKDENDSIDDVEDLNEYRSIINTLNGNLDESMFLESQEDTGADTEAKATYDECLNCATRHAFFGSTKTHFGAEMASKGASKNLRYPPDYFPGIMIDNGSTGSLCSVAQLEAYRKFTGNPTPVRKLKNHFVISAHGGSKCIGVATFKFPYENMVIAFDAPIVENSDTPLILGLSDQDRLGSRGADQLKNTIVFHDGPEMPLTRENNHLWIRWDYTTECLYTQQELTKLHYRFGHPGVRRMHEFLKRVKPEEVDKETRASLEEIQAKCKECQYLAPKPYVVKVAVPHEDVMFNSEVIVDIMYIQGRPILHAVDRATHFQAARFMLDISAETVWKTFVQMWSLIYLGAPDNLRHDQGVQFISTDLQTMAAEAGVTCRPIGVEGPNAMSVGERYHAPLRKTFEKLQQTYGLKPLSEIIEVRRGPGRPRASDTGQRRKLKRTITADDEYILAISVMCINSTVGPEGLCPSLLVFGAMPKLPLPGSRPVAVSQGERMMMMEKAREEYIKIVGNMRLKTAEKAFVPKSPPTTLQYGEKVLVFRDTTGRWEPRTFVSRNDHTILIIEPNGEVQPYPITRVSEYKEGTYLPRPDLYGLINNEITPEEPETPENPDLNTTPTLELPEEERFIEPEPETEGEQDPFAFAASIEENTEPISQFEMPMQVDVSTGVPVSFEDTDPTETFFTVYLKNNMEHIEDFKQAVDDEINGLMERGVFTKTLMSNFTKAQLQKMLIIKAKLILAVKEPGEPEERKKARIVAQAIRSKDWDKRMLMTYSPTVGRSSVRVMLSVATGQKLPIFTRDISQAYVSTNTKLLREVFLIPPKELGMDPDIIWKVERPLYGLPEIGVHWFETYVSHHHNVLRMKSTETDPCLLYRFNKKEKLDGLICLQVDDSIGAGSDHFLAEEENASKAFKSKGQHLLKDDMEIKFNGQHLKREKGKIFAHQKTYIDRMPTEKIPKNSASFMSHRGQAAYVSNCTRPDVACAVNQLSQVKEIDATDPDYKRIDEIFSRLKADDFRLCYGNVDIDTAEIHVFADASFATNKDLSSQLGYVILLVDDKGNCSFLSWSTSKCKRVTRSVLAAELYALAHGFDAGFALAHTVSKLLGRKMKVQVFTDSRTLFDSITSLCTMTEKRLLIDIYCLREAYRNGDLANLGWIRTQYNISDALTKDKKSSALQNVLKTHRIHTPVAQWITQGPISGPQN